MPSYSHLSSWEREQLAALKAAGTSGNFIAKALGRSAATISRELRRNCLPGGGYSPRQAHGAYLERRRRDAALEQDARLRQFVTDRLAEGWSPEQIAVGSNEAASRDCAASSPRRSTPSSTGHSEAGEVVALSGQAAAMASPAAGSPLPRHHQEPPLHP